MPKRLYFQRSQVLAFIFSVRLVCGHTLFDGHNLRLYVERMRVYVDLSVEFRLPCESLPCEVWLVARTLRYLLSGGDKSKKGGGKGFAFDAFRQGRASSLPCLLSFSSLGIPISLS